MKKKIYCFDFDGTLTTSDTLLEFIRYAKGTGRFLMVFLMYSPLLVLMKLHLFPNWKAKQLIFAHLFAGMRIEKFDALCRDFAEEYQHLLRPKGVTLVHESLVAGAQVFIVSASIDNWVRPFFKVRGLDGVRVLGTQIEVIDGRQVQEQQLLWRGKGAPHLRGTDHLRQCLRYPLIIFRPRAIRDRSIWRQPRR